MSDKELGDCQEDPVVHVAQGSNLPHLSQMVIYQSTVDAKLAQHEELGAAGHGVTEIAETFSQPDSIYNGRNPGVDFVHMSGTHDFEGHPLVVICKLVNGSSARFASAYYTSSYKQRTPIWKKGDGNE